MLCSDWDSSASVSKWPGLSSEGTLRIVSCLVTAGLLVSVAHAGDLEPYLTGALAKLFFSLYRLFDTGDRPWQAAEPYLGSRKKLGWFK